MTALSAAFPALTREQVYAAPLEPDFWRSVRPFDGAPEALRRLKEDGHRLLIVTATDYRIVQAKMEQVLFRYFPMLGWEDVIIAHRKQCVRGDVLVDDGVHNLVGGGYEKLLMDAPHNRAYDAAANGMTRVRNWDEAYAAICAIARRDAAR